MNRPVPAIYCDYNASTPVAPAVLRVVSDCQQQVFGNPSSVHRLGRAARALLDEARERVAVCWRCQPTEVVFTSGATEANNLAILGIARAQRHRGTHLITTAIEHPAVLAAFEHLSRHEGFSVTVLPPARDGTVAPDRVVDAMQPDTILVSVMAANNEIGTVQRVAEIGASCRERGVRFHTDAAQWFGKIPYRSIDDFGADLVSVCAHKLYGPKGIGALFIRTGVQLQPLLLGGGQEGDRRAGTENLAGAIGLAVALEQFSQPPVFAGSHMQALVQQLSEAASHWPGVERLGSKTNHLPNTVALAVEHVDAASLIASLDLEGICASSGSACSAGSTMPSHVLAALQLAPIIPRALLRLSLGRESTVAEVEFIASRTPVLIERLRCHGVMGG